MGALCALNSPPVVSFNASAAWIDTCRRCYWEFFQATRSPDLCTGLQEESNDIRAEPPEGRHEGRGTCICARGLEGPKKLS